MCKLIASDIQENTTMRTNIEIDDELLESAKVAAGLKNKKATVEEALRRLIRQEAPRPAIQDMAGLGWDGDLEAMRRSTPSRE
jgi:Arc/MetJ family transcription regulator